eukprot:8394231-Pyramimonas_sp.AAC.1
MAGPVPGVRNEFRIGTPCLMVMYEIPSSASRLTNLASVPSYAGNACFPAGSCCWMYRRYRLVAVL